ncbi:MAG: low affinity iron permease family protein [Pseudomonadota bacterium]|nr:low affinity iron permease family protein [Pseudomonadota bacterium]
MLDRFFTRIASGIAAFAGRPAAFVTAVAIIVLWGATGPLFHYSDTWQLVVNTATTIVTFLMVFLIQNSTNRDAAAMQAKLDELIRALEGARNGFIGIEHMTDKKLEELRASLEAETGADAASTKRSVDILANRL